MDCTISMKDQVQHVTKGCYFHVGNIGKTREYLTVQACKIITHFLVYSRLDYGNALLHGIPGHMMTRHQRYQNTFARISSRTRRGAAITPVLKSIGFQ